jgi:Fic family protein
VDNEVINSSPIGNLVPVKGSDARHGDFACFAFLPDPLPHDLDLATPTWNAVAEATAALARLDQECKRLPDPQLLIRPALWREALDTSALEGTYGQLSELLESNLPGSQFQSPETREISAYLDAARGTFNSIKSRPISVGLLCDAQNEMFKGSEKKPRDLGEIRKHQVWIGEENRPIDHARFVPCPGDDRLRSGLELCIEWIESESDLPIVLRVAMAHYQFETLHPFGDGNGRIGRLLIILQILRSGVIQEPAITLSPWFLRNRHEYQDNLLNLSTTGNWNPWVQFFCKAITEQCNSLIQGAESLGTWLSSAREIVVRRRWTGAIHELLNDLTKWPIVNISSTADSYNLTQAAAARIIDHLCEVDILTEMTGGSYARRFGAKGVIDIVDRI